jgi:membrane protease YdiL (CAAX protease family)
MATSPAGLAAELSEGSAVQRRPLLAFFVLTYVVSWAIWGTLAATETSIATPLGGMLNVVATAGPTIAALLVAVLIGGETLGRLLSGFSLRLATARWIALAVLLPLALITIAIGLSVVGMGGATPLITAGVLGAIGAEWLRVVLLGGPLEEELGWRGFALPRLQLRWSAWNAALLLGLLCGLWHLPLYLVPGTGQFESVAGDPAAGVPLIAAFVLWTIGLSVVFAWLFNASHGSLIVVILFHASVNTGSFIPGAVASTGAASMIYALLTWVVALVVVWRFGRATLGGSG